MIDSCKFDAKLLLNLFSKILIELLNWTFEMDETILQLEVHTLKWPAKTLLAQAIRINKLVSQIHSSNFDLFLNARWSTVFMKRSNIFVASIGLQSITSMCICVCPSYKYLNLVIVLKIIPKTCSVNQSINNKKNCHFHLVLANKKQKGIHELMKTKICHMKLVKIQTKMNGDAVFLVKCVCVFCLCSCSCVLCVCGWMRACVLASTLVRW